MPQTSFEAEVAHAVDWLVGALLAGDSPHKRAFGAALKAELTARYANHWYPEEPHRGCAYRSIECTNGSLDPLLLRALATAEVPKATLQAKDHWMLWCNPGEVKVSDSGVKSHAYCAGAAPNPYSRPKVRIEPTKVNARSEDEGSASSSSSSPSPTPKGSPKAVALSPSATEFKPSSQSSESSEASDSDDEQELLQMPFMPQMAMPPQAMQFAPPGIFVQRPQPGTSWGPSMTPAPPGMWPAPAGWQPPLPVKAH